MQAKHMTQDFILVEAPGLPYTYSIYEGVLAMLAFFREVQPLLSWGKPTVQVFGLTPERCIMKVCMAIPPADEPLRGSADLI